MNHPAARGGEFDPHRLKGIVYCPVQLHWREQMTKADVIEAVSSNCGFSKKESIDLVQNVFSLIKRCLARRRFEDIRIRQVHGQTQESKSGQKSANRRST
jgi:hypothetical protein